MVMLNPKYAAAPAGAPLQIDSLLALPAMYSFASEAAILDVLTAHAREDEARRARVAELRGRREEPRSVPAPAAHVWGPAAATEWNVFLVNAAEPEPHLHGVRVRPDSRVASIYNQLPSPYSNANEWTVVVRCDGRALDREQTLIRAGVCDGAVLQLEATPKKTTVLCDTCGATLSLEAFATHDCPALRRSADGTR